LATSGQPTLSVVIPIYNEEQCIDMLYERLTAALADVEGGYEIVFANDGSHDRSEEMLRELISRDERLSLVNLSRNFGHQPAISAGLAQAAA